MKVPAGGCLRSAQRATAEFTRASKAKVAATTRRMANQSGRPWRLSKRFITVVSVLRSPQRLGPTAVPRRRDESFRICEGDPPDRTAALAGWATGTREDDVHRGACFRAALSLGRSDALAVSGRRAPCFGCLLRPA